MSRPPAPSFPRPSQRATTTPNQHNKHLTLQKANSGLPHASRAASQFHPTPNSLARQHASSSYCQPNLSLLDRRQHPAATSKNTAPQSVAARSARHQTEPQGPAPTLNNHQQSAAPRDIHPHKRHRAMPAPKSNSPHQDDAEVEHDGDENRPDESTRVRPFSRILLHPLTRIQNKKKSRKRAKPCITDFEGLRKEIARHASQDARAYISVTGLFARRTQIDIWIEEAWLRANQTNNRGRPALQILPEERTWVCLRLCRLVLLLTHDM
jgi:hypothetical protein